MGSHLSTSETPTLTDAQVKFQKELQAAMPYICGNVKGPLKVDPTVKLQVCESKLESAFLEDRNMGLFTINAIPKGTIILKTDLSEECRMNDGMINLEPIFRAQTSEEMYSAWSQMRKNYYDIEKMSKVINVRMVSNGGDPYYETIQDVPAGAELLRVYGFTSWVFEILNIFTNKTIGGFAHFMKEFSEDISGDPFEMRIKQFLSNWRAKDSQLFMIEPGAHDAITDKDPVQYYKF